MVILLFKPFPVVAKPGWTPPHTLIRARPAVRPFLMRPGDFDFEKSIGFIQLLNPRLTFTLFPIEKPHPTDNTMKTPLISLILILWSSSTFATIRTLCNMPYSPGQFTTFFNAHAFSSPGDTIYVHGSDFSYGDVSISIPLVIIGTGHNPIKQSPLVSTFGDIVIFSNNVQLVGLTIGHILSAASDGIIRRCKINPQLSSWSDCINFSGLANGWLIEGTVFEGKTVTGLPFYTPGIVVFGPANNLIVRNNVFANLGEKIVGITNASGQASYIYNNIFFDNSSSFATFVNVNLCVINNNIFYGASPVVNTTLVPNCEFNYNISYLAISPSFFSLGTNNLESVDPLFTTYSSPPAFFVYSDDYRLTAGSPGLSNGSDGTDRGVYGGFGGIFSMSGEPAIAEVSAFTITSATTIPPGGTLTISVTSKRVP